MNGYIKWIIILILGEIILICNEAKEDSFKAFHGIMGFFLIMYLIIRIFMFIGKLIDNIEDTYKNHKENRIVEDKYLEKLEKLSILKLQNALTDEEFEEQKAKILKKIK